MASNSVHSKNAESHSSFNSNSFNSDPEGKGFVNHQKSTGSRRCSDPDHGDEEYD